MAANPNDPRTKRRKAMGDDPNKVAMSPQPLPGAPQQNNVMNYPMTDANGQMGQQIGSGQGQFPYGDINMDKQTSQKLGSVGFVDLVKNIYKVLHFVAVSTSVCS